MFYIKVPLIKEIIGKKFHVMEALSWKENTDTDVYVINRHTGDVRHLTTQPMYSLHHANAYQINKVQLIMFDRLLFLRLI